MNDTNINEEQLRSEIEDLKRQLASRNATAGGAAEGPLFTHRGGRCCASAVPGVCRLLPGISAAAETRTRAGRRVEDRCRGIAVG